MNCLFSASVSLNSSKCCFVGLSADIAQRLPTSVQDPGKVIIFKVEWPEGVAYVSWSGDVAVNRSVGIGQTQSSAIIEIGRKFAYLNGIQDGEQVVLTLVDRTSTPSCARVHVDPFSPDDWEILELHAGFIELNLLNQVRVVWRRQVIPIWINKTTCVVITIGETDPPAACVVLEEFTEVIIAPKQRSIPSSKKSESAAPLNQGQQPFSHQLTERENDTSNDASALNPDKLNSKDTYSSKVYHWWNYFLHGEEMENNKLSQAHSTNENQIINTENDSAVNNLGHGMKRNCCRHAFETAELDLCLRSHVVNDDSQIVRNQERSGKRTDKFLRQFTVFLHPSSVRFQKLKCGKDHPVVFTEDYEGLAKIVVIKKVLSPRERMELLNISKGKGKGSESSQGNQGMKDVMPKPETSISPAVVKMVLSKDTLPGHISMNSLLQKQLGSDGMSRFLISHVTYEPREVQGLILHPIRDTLAKIEELGHDVVLVAFQTWVCQAGSEASPLVIWNGATVTYDCQGIHLEMSITVLSHTQSTSNPENIPYHNIMPSTLDRIKVVIGDVRSMSKGVKELLQVQSDYKAQCCCTIKDLGGFDEPFKKCMNHLLVSLTKDPFSTLLSGGLTAGLGNGAVLICGSGTNAGEGCGKTSLAHTLCHQLQQWPVCAHVTIIDCIPLRAKRVETIQRQWQQAFAEAAWYQPSVILLDNLDHVISAPNLTQEMGGEGFYRKRLVEVFKDLLAVEVANSSSIAVIATSRSLDSLHAALQSGHGSHIFQCCVELGALSEEQREEVLSVIIKRRFENVSQQELDAVLKSVTQKSEGFSPKDLSRLTDKALHFSVVRKNNKTKEPSQPCLLLDDFHQALSGFIPASLQGVHLHKAGELSWSDVGGLQDVKEALKETLLWPSKYRKIFLKCPLRLRSGLLLYGPPGTGKTLLAGIVAKESGLNFISIKGPELLSKYIGSSEQAVRDVFAWAQTAKPCILFFDEFDSLAPRRGHDSTGVTDRVVNQLLTQLDGVEGLEGVYILAATSRPGLIDPALLRPGRLDKCVYCPIPNKSERLEILLALTHNIPLADDVDLQTLADKCDHFTGADLKALLYNAQLESIHRCTSKLKLYGNIFNTQDETKQLGNPKEDKDEMSGQLSVIQESFLAFSISEGKKTLSREDCDTIQTELAALEKKHSALQTMAKSEKKENIIYITQSDLDRAASTMRPSVSPKERLGYENLYDSFVKSRGGSFTKNLPLDSKATLA